MSRSLHEFLVTVWINSSEMTQSSWRIIKLLPKFDNNSTWYSATKQRHSYSRIIISSIKTSRIRWSFHLRCLPPLPRLWPRPPLPPPCFFPPPSALFTSDLIFMFSGKGRIWSTHFLKLKSSKDSSVLKTKKQRLFHSGWWRISKALMPEAIFFSGSGWPLFIRSRSTICSYWKKEIQSILLRGSWNKNQVCDECTYIRWCI